MYVKILLKLFKATLPNGFEKDEALRFISQGDHHQILRKEILFGLRPTTLTGLNISSLYCIKLFLVGKNQGLEMISDLMVLLENGGFFRDNGLNSLPSIKHIGALLNDPGTFKNFEAKIQTIVSFVRKRKFLEQTYFVQLHLDTNRLEEEVHSPIVGVEMYSKDDQNVKIQKHAVVLKTPKQLG